MTSPKPSEWAAVASEIDACRQQLRECERSFGVHRTQDGDYDDDEKFAADREYLGFRLYQAHLRLLILIEHSNLPLFHKTYMAGFSKFGHKLADVQHSRHDPDDLYSEALIHIDQSFDALSAMVLDKEDRDVTSLALFERILRQTPYILNDRSIVPANEKEVRQPLFDLLKTVFPDCRREIPISHLFKHYHADIGVSSLKSLVEVKYALDEKELRNELDGIFADINGYAGDPQWTRFFALFYTASPIAAPERLLEEFKLSRVDISWIPIVVHGTGTRKRASKSSA